MWLSNSACNMSFVLHSWRQPLSMQWCQGCHALLTDAHACCTQLYVLSIFSTFVRVHVSCCARTGDTAPATSKDQMARQAAAVLADVQAAKGKLQEAKAAWLSLAGDESSWEHWVHGGLGAVLLKLKDMQVRACAPVVSAHHRACLKHCHCADVSESAGKAVACTVWNRKPALLCLHWQHCKQPQALNQGVGAAVNL